MEHIDTLILDFLSHRLSREGFEELRRWALSSGEHRDYVRRKIELWFSSSVAADATPYDSDAAYRRFTERIARAGQGVPAAKSPARNVHLWRWVAAAAAVVLIALLPFAGYRLGTSHTQEQFADITVSAPRGSQLSLTMPDGTRVRLNSGSTLTYSQGYGIHDRRMTLHGEGMFTVTHNDKLPMVINTKELSVEDLGTKFVLANYDDMDIAELTLIEGRVRWTDHLGKRAGQTLRPGETMTLNKRTLAVNKGKAEGNSALAVDFDILRFANEPLGDIAKTLARAYNVNISVSAKASALRFYGTFNRREVSVDGILRLFVESGHVSYRHVWNTYYIY